MTAHEGGTAQPARLGGILVDIWRWPATGLTVLTSVAVTVATWIGLPIEHFVAAEPVLLREPWRLTISALPHLDPLHLAFNIAWTWILGHAVESRIGSRRTLGLIVLLALVSGATEYTLLAGGLGLSGVCYGLFGYLWARKGADPTIESVLPKKTISLFIGWFFLCIVLTVTELLPVANLAHASGCILGVIIGRGWHRTSLAITVAILIAAFAARPILNVGGERASDYSYFAWLAAEAGDTERAIEWGATAVKIDPRDVDAWVWYGLVLEVGGQLEEAMCALRKATELDSEDAVAWFNYGLLLHELGQFKEALAAYDRAIDLDPGLASMADLVELREWVTANEN